MNDVAVRAGVSRSTASFALNGRQEGVRIPPETRRRILDAAAELGYRPNQLARAMVTGKSRLLGLVMETPGRDFEFKSKILAGVSEGAAEAGYTVKVLYLPPADPVERILESCLQWHISGLVTVALESSLLELLRPALSLHQISLSAAGGSRGIPWGIHLGSDDVQGMSLALNHLKSLGHRSVGFLGAGERDPVSESRLKAFRSAAAAHQLPFRPEHVFFGDWWEVAPNERAARSCLTSPNRPSAVVCAADSIAAVLLNVARSLQVRVPAELSVIGYGNHSLSSFSDPALSTLAPPLEETGRQLVQLLAARIASGESGELPWTDEAAFHTLPLELVERGSTGPCPPPG